MPRLYVIIPSIFRFQFSILNLQLHRFQVVSNDELGLGGGLHLIDREFGMDLLEDDALGGHFHHTHFGDDEVHLTFSGEGKVAFFEDFRVPLLGVFHGKDHALGTYDEVHGTAHAGGEFAGNHPVGEVAVLVHLHGAEDGGVNVAAADDAEGGG